MKEFFCGIDTALVNMGAAVLSLDSGNHIGLELGMNAGRPGKKFLTEHSEMKPLHRMLKKSKADFLKTSWGVGILRFILESLPAPPAFTVCEGPAFGIRGMNVVSVGESHGAVQSFLFGQCISFGVCAPVAIKSFMAGDARASKDAMIEAASELVGEEIKDHNTADAIAMALYAMCFHFYRMGADLFDPVLFEEARKSRGMKAKRELQKKVGASPRLIGILESLPLVHSSSDGEIFEKRLESLFRFYLKENEDWIVRHSKEGARTCRERSRKPSLEKKP